MEKRMVILFGAVAIVVGIFLTIKENNKRKRCTTKARGTVVEIIEEMEENTKAQNCEVGFYDAHTYVYFPVIEYETRYQKIKQKYSTGYGNKDKYQVGDNVDILYDENKPEDYLIEGDNSSNILGIGFMVAGLGISLIGIINIFHP